MKLSRNYTHKRFGTVTLFLVSSICFIDMMARAASENYSQLVQRFRALEAKAASFGPDYEPLYRAALAWFPAWGNHTNDPADTWFVAPDEYAAEFADALEHGRNFIAEHLGSAFPLAFEKRLPDGTLAKANYQLNLPDGFPGKGYKFPLIIGLHGSGWLGHKISYVRDGRTGGRVFQVTPINEGGPWKLDFLNAYLDELLQILPVDPDKVYVEGHSLGAMATWDWAMNNPERFAAISPRDGAGSPFRASRLKNIPVWVVHGSADDVIPAAYADQMVSALQAAGGTVKYSLLKGAPHNLPPDFDQQAVVSWYLQQTRSHLPPPADPLDTLGLGTSGFSQTVMITLPAGWFWKSATVPWQAGQDRRSGSSALEKSLFSKVKDRGALVDSPVRQGIDSQKQTRTLWLMVPNSIHSQAENDASVLKLPERKAARFYGRGDAGTILGHAASVSAQLKGEGKLLSDTVWLTPLTSWRHGSNNVNECWIELK
jgi:dienelactone hydrolase